MGAAAARTPGLLVGVCHERVVPADDERFLVGPRRSQASFDGPRVDQVAELEEPGVDGDLREASRPRRDLLAEDLDGRQCAIRARHLLRTFEDDVGELAGCLIGHREEEQRVRAERRGPHPDADNVTVVNHGDEPARDAIRPRDAGGAFADDALGDRRDDGAQDWLLGEVPTGGVEELTRVVEEVHLHAGRVRRLTYTRNRFSVRAGGRSGETTMYRRRCPRLLVGEAGRR